MKRNFFGSDMAKYILGIVFSAGLVYGTLATDVQALKKKDVDQDNKLSGLASKEDVLEVRKDLRAWVQGRELPPLPSQASPSERQDP
jgi:hypothetical protein